MPLMRNNARASLAEEPECHRFDICTDAARPGEVLLFELYSDTDAFAAHLQTAHYRDFDAATAAMIDDKRVMTYGKVE